ncbi:MAG: hypothetical protein DME26_18950 [Verrucomicrobia bacterium]|nr:MAG: hypothetical protein DME26_18950 [Verrucomicrobiota bacterium]
MFAALAANTPSSYAVNTNLLTKLVAYYLLNTVSGGTSPEYVNGYNLTLQNLSAASLGTGYTNYDPVASMNANYGLNDKTFVFLSANSSYAKYTANVGDLVPVSNLREYTVSMWVCVASGGVATNVLGDPAAADDRRWYAEQFFPNNSNPLFVVGTQIEDTGAHWFIRSQGQRGFPPYGYAQTPDYNGAGSAGGTSGPYPNCCEQQSTSTTDASPGPGSVADGAWHHLAWTMDTNGSFSVFVDGVYNSGKNQFSSNRVASVTDNGDGSFTTNYLPSVLPDRVMKNQNGERYLYTLNTVSFGGLARTVAGSTFVDGRIDDVCMWARALSTNEINEVIPPKLNSFVSEFPEALQGDTAPLRWNVTRAQNAASIRIDKGVGEVSSLTDTSTGIGVVHAPVYSNTTFTISVAYTNGVGFTNTLSVTVNAYTNKTANPSWHVLSRFDNIGATTGGIIGPGTAAGIGWASPASDFAGNGDRFNVRNLSSPTNFVATEGGLNVTNRPALSLLSLNSYTLKPGQSNTLFFRLYIANTNCTPFTFGVAITSKGFFGLGDYIGNQGGVGLQLTRLGGLDPIDLQAFSGAGASQGTYSYLGDPQNGSPAGLQKATVYNVWIDTAVGPVLVDTNSAPPQTNGTLYSIYISTNGGARIGLVTNFTSDLDYINFNPTVGIPGTNFDRLVLTYDTTFDGTGNNVVLVDDIYLSTSGFNSTLPVAVLTFNPAAPIVVTILGDTNLVYDAGASSFTLNWVDTGCGPYTVKKSASLSPANWVDVASGLTATTYTDSIAPGDTNVFYRITSP